MQSKKLCPLQQLKPSISSPNETTQPYTDQHYEFRWSLSSCKVENLQVYRQEVALKQLSGTVNIGGKGGHQNK